ncbi:MAG: hypothetical protein OXG02_00435 [Chloroflexi bacterium]|nr:hypothetical protein [Chloroflexota bacterium]
MIRKLRSDRRVRRITRSLVRLYMDLTWIDEPLFWRNRVDNHSTSIIDITKKFSATDHENRIWHKWGFVGDTLMLRNFLKDYISHKTEEEFAQGVHDLACKMLKKGYIEYTPESYIGSRYEGNINDVGDIKITQRRGTTTTGGHLSLSQKAYSLPSNDLMHFVSLLSTFLVSHATALILIILALLQIIEIVSNLGIVEFSWD